MIEYGKSFGTGAPSGDKICYDPIIVVEKIRNFLDTTETRYMFEYANGNIVCCYILTVKDKSIVDIYNNYINGLDASHPRKLTLTMLREKYIDTDE